MDATNNFLDSYKDTLREALRIAVEKMNGPIMETLILAGADPNTYYEDAPLLHKVIETGEELEEYVSVFINAGANINATNRNGESALHVAVKKEDGFLLENLLKQGGDMYLRNTQGLTLLHYAAFFNDFDSKILSDILKQGLWDINEQDAQGNTILHNRLMGRNLGSLSCEAIYNCLLYGANYKLRNFENSSPTFLCSCEENGRSFIECPLMQYLAKLVIVNFPCQYVNEFLDSAEELPQLDYVLDEVTIQVVSEIRQLKKTLLRGFSKKISMYDFMFLNRYKICRYTGLDTTRLTLKKIESAVPQLFHLLEVKFIKGKKRASFIKESKNVMWNIVGSSKLAEYCIEKICFFMPDKQLLEWHNADWESLGLTLYFY